MFQSPKPQRSSHFWKVLPLVAVTFAILVGLFVYLFEPKAEREEEITGVLRLGNPDFAWYNKYVALKKPRVKIGRNYAGNRMVMFSAVIENHGEKTLDVVEVKLVFFNADVPVWESTRVPIRPGTGTYTPPIEPLGRRGFTLYVESLPEGWQASNAEMEIHGFRFE